MLVEGEGEEALPPVLDHEADRVLGGDEPALDLPVGAVDDGLCMAESGLEDGQAANDRPCDWVAKSTGRPAIPSELGIEKPIPGPLRAELTGRLVILDEKNGFALGQHVEAARVQEGVTCGRVPDIRERDGESELHCGGASGEAMGLDDIPVHWVLGEVLDQGEEKAVVGLGRALGRDEVSPEAGSVVQRAKDRSLLGQPLVVEGLAPTFQPGGVSPAEVEVDVAADWGDGAKGGIIPVGRALLEGGDCRIVDEKGEGWSFHELLLELWKGTEDDGSGLGKLH